MDIKVEGLTLQYGDNVAVRDLDVEIGKGESLVLLGQSGCGKTSTMRCIAGLETPTTGRITVGDTVLFDAERGINRPSNKRNIGMVFQSYAIWPHMTVFENVAFSLTIRRRPKQEVRDRVMETLELVGLEGFADRGASRLSGGQMQRVALARSLVMQPSVMLLDEPLSNLDARLRTRLRADLRELQQSLGLTSVYVTHDQEEALALADRIAMMQFGRIVQIGSPHEIYSKPRSASIADFLGVGNVLPVEPLDGAHVRIAGSDIALQVPEYVPADELRACIRAEDIEYIDEESGANCIRGRVATREFLGATAVYRVQVAPDVQLEVAGSKRHLPPQTEGEEILLRLDVEAIQVLPADVDDIPRSDVPTTSVGQVGV
ncbi:ABC transporter ATP-binding protein [Gulosibacter sp. 10]|uniref:ABC transporter ATP-binding protein n=1 Tax=Gulosibacter sp. 10 TaxID=1255570 RepID=UPI00097EDEE0|nr:ABC transporter ATP-binding protein [Gulosibacter sp. 10]SJM55024.1 Putrescine transport ATP-binding protein PotA (TC 3.A.1.11.1) [Gulosibacter sp. 10]